MERIDLHTHSTFSHDGNAALADMVAAAHLRGLKYYGVSEHFDYDCAALGVTVNEKPLRQIDAQAYFTAARSLQKQDTSLLVGCEFGYANHADALAAYAQTIARYKPDFVINSVHVCDEKDCYFPDYFAEKSMRRAYESYLACVRESLDAPYAYDIVGHIGYVSRNAPYENKKLRYDDYVAQLNDILETVIAKRAVLEVNISARGALSAFLPDTDILQRYYDLGGRALSFGSDAHDTSRIAERYDETVSTLRAIGFTHFTVPVRGKRIEFSF